MQWVVWAWLCNKANRWVKTWVKRWRRREEQGEKNGPVIRKRRQNSWEGRECGAFWRTETHPRWWQQGWRWSPRVRQAPPGLEHDHMCSGHNGPNKSKLKQTSCLVSQWHVQGRLQSCSVSEDWWRPWVSCLGGSLPRPLHLPPPLLPHQLLDSGLGGCPPPPSPPTGPWVSCDAGGIAVRLSSQVSGTWSTQWVCISAVSGGVPGVWFFSSAELSPKLWEGGSKQQSLHATELVHHCAPASVSCLILPGTCWGWRGLPRNSVVPSVYWENLRQWWSAGDGVKTTRRTGPWSHTFKCW